MQLNIYVPQQKRDVLQRLEEEARRSGRAKNELVLEALERYLMPASRPLGVFSMGFISEWTRDDLYSDRLSI